MNLTINRDSLLRPLTLVSGAIERRHTVAILSNVLLDFTDGVLSLTGTDMEVELVATTTDVQASHNFRITVPARKLFDICKSLPDNAEINIQLNNDSLLISCGKSRFTLSTLAADSYPNLENLEGEAELTVKRNELRRLIESTAFSMANQDVRYYLNGMSFELEGEILRTVATDGHRLALGTHHLGQDYGQQRQVIIPRKGVLEVQRLLEDDDNEVKILIGSNHFRMIDQQSNYIFTCKLVDGRFPDYRRVIPRNGDKIIVARRDDLKDSFLRASILSNEKFRGVRLNFSATELLITANNPEQEQAEEYVEINYGGTDLEIGFNVSYLIEVLNTLRTDDVQITLIDGNSSALIEGMGEDNSQYVVMPMRI